MMIDESATSRFELVSVVSQDSVTNYNLLNHRTNGFNFKGVQTIRIILK
jgi:hypothetical protein